MYISQPYLISISTINSFLLKKCIEMKYFQKNLIGAPCSLSLNHTYVAFTNTQIIRIMDFISLAWAHEHFISFLHINHI